MADAYDLYPDLAWLLDAALVFNGTDAYAAARRIAERLGISEDDLDGAAERALREALGALRDVREWHQAGQADAAAAAGTEG